MKSTIKLLVLISLVNLLVITGTAIISRTLMVNRQNQANSGSGFSLEKLKNTENPPSGLIIESPLPSPTVLAPKPTVIRVDSQISKKPIPAQVTPTPTPTPSPTPTPTPTPDNRCIVTIDGVRYDVTQFRSIHSGGNIFNCEADMSAEFWGQHGQKQLDKMQKYRI